ncbi:hypothetical protein BU14_0070s0023 [Porphyra umbilicalis]|uniref:Peptidyl-prolyl cis-trans isomerase n=1 Tax=Porphyra umbilicalis TaxID=2786 RepID=A0A1X6PGD1_PORUM|nr:hypothetical protein BU14_0070s0023 [Porphyra umbilicalis]|eukprot:OSX79848.1 hypothetical protein BU14_0070s0023 [Porphyra umbilicalis]
MSRGGPRLIPLATSSSPLRPPARRYGVLLAVLTAAAISLTVGVIFFRGGGRSGGDAAAVDADRDAEPVFDVAADALPPTTTVLGAAAAAPSTRVFLDVAHDNATVGRLTLGLFDARAPRTVANFVALATGTGGPPPVGGEPGTGTAGFAGVAFHRVIAGFMAQGGDYERGDGRGGRSIYPGGKFDDEPFVTTHDSRGVLSMANSGPNTNGAQFFITFKATPWLDGKHVVFGRVLDGANVLDAIERVDTVGGSRPSAPLVISACGVLDA